MPRYATGKISALVLGLALGACASHEITGLSDPVPGGDIQRIFIATQRTPDQIENLFGATRTRPMNYGLVDVSVPPNHKPGRIEWPGNTPDPSKEFAVVNVESFSDDAEFRSRVRHAKNTDGGITILFVHGFNTTIPEATLRFAQIKADFDEDAPSVMFGWPSAGDPLAYLYDRDSVLFARDDLVKVLRDITTETDRKVALVAHSMGAHLAMEAMRQIAISGDRKLLSKIVWVALVSPDIDPDVFRRQAESIGQLPEEFYILVAKQDGALSLSSFLTGGRRRVGAIEGPEQVEGLDVTVFDLSQLAADRDRNHGVAFNSPSAIAALTAIDSDTVAPRVNSPEFIVFDGLLR